MNKQSQSPAAGPAHGRDLTVGSIPHHLVAFSLPMLAGSALQTAYSFINAVWVGKFLGKSALAAVTVSFPVIFVLIAVGAGLTLATNILISQNFGAKDYGSLRKVVDSSTVMIGALSLLLVVLGEIFTPRILAAMNTPRDVFPMSVSYMRIFLLSLPFGFGLFLTRSMLQGIGDSTTPLYFQTASVVFSAILDPLLMFGLVGFPKLGLNGTAWAAVIAQVGALAALVFYLHRKRSIVAANWRRLEAEWATAWTTIRIGVPSAVQQSLISVGMVFVTGIVNGFGENATAAFGAAGRIDQLAFMPAMTFSMAIATLAGQNIGAKKHERVKDIFMWGCILSGGITLLASILVVAIPKALLKIFVNDQTVISLGTDYLHIVGACYIFFAVMFVSNGVINGAGHTLITTLMSLISLWIVRVPLAYYLCGRMHSVSGVWYSFDVSFAVSMIISVAYYYSGKWKKPINKRTPTPTVEVASSE